MVLNYDDKYLIFCEGYTFHSFVQARLYFIILNNKNMIPVNVFC